jgi:hypothetical protein
MQLLLLFSTVAWAAEPSDTALPEEPKVMAPEAPSIWSRTLTGRASVGYNDNILQEARDPEQSLTLGAGVEATLIRLPLDGRQVLFDLSGDYTHYLQGDKVNHEAFLVGLGELRLDLSPSWQTALALETVFLDQVIDTTITEDTPTNSLVRGTGITARPSVRRDWAGAFWMDLSAGVTRQFFRQPFDDYWEAGPKLSVGRDYGYRSALSLGYSWRLRPYDTRDEVSQDGTDQAGTQLRFQLHELELLWRHNWDAQRRWRTTTRLDILANRDSGSGYFDYQRYQATEQLRYVAKAWEMKGHVRLAYYHFTEQQVSDPDSDLRVKTLVGAGLRAERRLSRYLKLFGDYSYEKSLSNLGTDEYTVNKVAAGLECEY